MPGFFRRAATFAAVTIVGLLAHISPNAALATEFTMTVPGTGVGLPPEYPEAGGVAIVMTGANGNIYYQFSDPSGAFVGYQYRGRPPRFRGNPFTINDPISLDCGFRDCDDYFGGSIARIDVRFSAYDGDTQVDGFDEDQITLVMNGYDVGNWSGRDTEITDNTGATGFGMVDGFGNNTFNTGWFSSTNPALLGNILDTGQTTTQVRDQTPNDNYWDFTRGVSLDDEEIRTIAPGYELTKERRGGDTTFLEVGQVITYDYLVSNIGSVRISDITVDDDKIGSVACVPTTLDRTVSGTSINPETAACEATYRVTQEDVDAGELTNVAVANGTPEFGELGQLEAEVTLTGPAFDSEISLAKSATPFSFTTVGQIIDYTLTVTNEGNTTLTNVVVTDPELSGFSCVVPELLPLSADNTNNTADCTGTYEIRQVDIDNAGLGIVLTNNASVTARDPANAIVSDTASTFVVGPVAAPAMELSKLALTSDFDAVGDVLEYEISVTNTGNVTWFSTPTVTDTFADTLTCGSGSVAPSESLVCTATYAVIQADIDAGEVENIASATVDAFSERLEDFDAATVPAVLLPEFNVVKSLAGGPSPFTTVGDALTYSYVITNTGNVQLDNVVVGDDLVDVVCPDTSVAAGGTLTCTSTADPYVIDQTDLDDGDVTNVVTVTATTPDGAVVAPATDTLTVNADQAPALSIEKSGALLGTFATDEVIRYTFVVENAGNVTLTDPITVDDNKFADPIACPLGDLAPTSTITCTADYVITAADSAAGFVSNVAAATDGTTTSPTDDFSIGATGQPALGLDKVATQADFDSTADTIDYTYTVSNTGTRDIDTGANPITIADDKIAFADFTCTVPPILFADALDGPTSYQCTASYDVTQTDLDAGEVVNIASASTTISGAEVASPEATETVPSAITPAFTFAKDATEADYDAVGDTINYTFTIVNLTEETLSSVVIDDPLLGGVICTITDLGPLATDTTCTASYSVDQADLDNGSVDNDATAVATSATGTTLEEDASESVPFDPAAANRSLSLDKRASTASYAAVGDTIQYVIDVTNDGNLTLTDIVVTDIPLGLTCTIAPLAPGETDSTCVGLKTITQTDIDNGSFTNAAEATADGGNITENDAETATGPTPNPDFDFTKTADGDFTVEGDVVQFTLSVVNTGNTTLNAITITDDFFDPDLTCAIGTLLPGESDTSCIGSYTVTQDDVDAGQITNTADITVTPPDGTPVPDTATAVVDGPDEDPSLTVAKVEGGGSPDGAFGALPTTETFTFSVTNTGNVTLENVMLEDAFFDPDFSCTLPDIAPGDTATTCADLSPLSVTYTVDQDDIDFGAITNTVTVTASTEQGSALEETDTLTLTGPDQLPELEISKTSPDTTFAVVGDTLTYSYDVLNDGNITITSQITVDDDRTSVTCPDIGAGLAPGDTLTCTATYTVDQQDLDDGQVENIATASVTQPVVPSATYPSGVADITSDPDSVNIAADRMPELDLVKRIEPGTDTTFDAVGDTISFEFIVTNTGNVTTTGPITIDDPTIGVNFECTADLIAPGGTATCTTTWTAMQEDIDAGSFTNTATASTPIDGGTTTSDPADATVQAVQTPEMTVIKEFSQIIGVGFTSTSQAEYTYRVSNTGNQTIEGPIDIVDNLIGTFECTPDDLAPTDPEITCTAIYDITAQDVTFGSVTNTAFGTSPTVDSNPTSETIPQGANPSIEITKVPNITTFSAVGDVLTYTYSVTNTSPGDPAFGRPSISAIQPIVISDDNIEDENGATTGQLDCFPSATVTELLPDQTLVCEDVGSYTVTQEDLDAVRAGSVVGFVENNATGIIDIAQPISSPPVNVIVDGVAAPVLLMEKFVSAGNDPAAAGDTLEYTVRVTNDGNQTISGIAVDDPMIPGLVCDYTGLTAEDALSPGEVVDCVGTYVVSQDDINAQVLENTATADGTNPQGTPVNVEDTITHPLEVEDPSVVITKTLAEGEPNTAFSAVGEMVPYQITVLNDGNITLAETTVTDILFPGESCVIGPLQPGETDTSCVFVYEVLQEDIDRGFVNNEATATSVTDQDDPETVTDDDDISGNGPDQEPELGVLKVADVATVDAEGDVINYTYTISNNGNVTIEAVPAVSDDRIDPSDLTCDPVPSGELLPGEFFTCTAAYTVTQDDIDDGGVTNIVTATVTDPTDPGGPPLETTDTVTVDAIRDPAFTVAKSAPGFADVDAGDVITYEYRVENTGNVTLTDVMLVDSHVSAAGPNNLTILPSDTIGTLDVDEVVILTATYLVTQEDLDASQPLTNTVTADATPPLGVTPPETQTDDLSIDVADPDPSLEVVKTVAAPALVVPGASVVFTITVENTGNVTLDNVALDDTLSRADDTVIFPDPTPTLTGGDSAPLGELEVDETWTYSFTHVLTQDDIDAGGLSNTVTATADDPFGFEVDDVSNNTTDAGDDPTTLTIAPTPSVVGQKTITSSTIAVDEVVEFEITVENTGNVTLTDVQVADDTLLRADNTPLSLTSGPTFVSADDGSGAGTLQVGETATYRATYRLTQDDIDAGGINNQATVSGEDPNGTVVDDVTDDGGAGTEDPTTLVIPADPSIAMVKALTDGGPTFNAVGDVLEYTFTVTNTGNVTLDGTPVISDPLITDAGGTIACEAGPLAPGDALECVGTYAVEQDDIDNGSVENSATADLDGVTSDPSETSTPSLQEPALETVKAAESITTGDPAPNDVSTTIDPEFFETGAVITYSYTVTNTGNTTLDGPISIADNLITDPISCDPVPLDGLEPGDALVCTGTYTVTTGNVAVGAATNVASATMDGTTSPDVEETVPAGASPAIGIDKELIAVNGDAGRTDFDMEGDTLTYLFTVTNDGNAAFARDVVVTDALLSGPLVCYDQDADPLVPNLVVDATATCEATITVTQDQVDAGEVVNQAFATTLFGVDEDPVTSGSATETVPADEMPGLEIVKSASLTDFTVPLQDITYTLTITNNGNQTLTDVEANDDLLGLTCDIGTMLPGAIETCDAVYTTTQDDVDRGFIDNDATVSAIDPRGMAVEDDDTLRVNGPDPLPSFELTKTASPDPFGDVGSAITYTFSVLNTGNVTLTDVMISDDIVDPAFTCTVDELAVGATDDTCALSYTVTQDDKDAGEIENTASATAEDPNGDPVTDEDMITTPSAPTTSLLQAIKTADVPATTRGTTITYTLTLRNLGDVTLDIDGITDTMTRRDFAGTPTALSTPFGNLTGDTDGDGRLDVTEVWTYTAAHVITQADIDAGGFDNTVTVTATDPFGDDASDVSDDGDNTDGNTTDDPTEVPIVPGPAIEAVKIILQSASVAGEEVIFEIYVSNTGNQSLTDITVADTLTRLDADMTELVIEEPVLVAPTILPATVAPGTTLVYQASYVLTQEDVDAGGISNTVLASAQSPDGTPVRDVSDDGNDGDGNLGDDPTDLIIVPTPAIVAVKAVLPRDDPDAAPVAGEVINFIVTVTNTGTVTLTDVSIADTLTNGNGDMLTPDEVAFTDGDDETTLAPNRTNIYNVAYTLTQADIDSGRLENTVLAEGTPPVGDPVTDVSDNGDDDDGNTTDDPTVFVIEQISAIDVVKEASRPELIRGTIYEASFVITVTNTGNLTQNNVSVIDDLAAFASPGVVVSTTRPAIDGWSGTDRSNANFDGVTNTEMLAGGVSLDVDQEGTVEITVRYDVANGFPAQSNVVSVSSDDLDGEVLGDVEIEQVAEPDIAASKTVAPEEALLGSTVTYTLMFENLQGQPENDLSIIDIMPSGVVFTPGTVQVDGADFRDPGINGNRLRWNRISLDPFGMLTLTFDARVVGDVGEMVNRTYMLGPDGAVVSNEATATLVRLPEPVFDCGDVIGKVFDDRNLNGYQDGVVEPDRSAITDQTYRGGKGALAPEVLTPDAEPGLPNVRLSTVTGTLITTDQYGRFSVPCAELPANIGSNFTLKLDERTLPSGYVVTTENPRVMRLTQGTVAKMNFGAAIANVIDIDLMAAAFSGDVPSGALSAGVDQLVQQLEDTPTVLNLTYVMNGESRDTARARLSAVEALVRDKWRGSGLRVERTLRTRQ